MTKQFDSHLNTIRLYLAVAFLSNPSLAYFSTTIIFHSPAQAATFAQDRECEIYIKGPIDSGDTDNLKAKFEQTNGDKYVCLDSEGGSYIEGVKLALLLRETGRRTLIRMGDKCLSACAIAFMGGARVEDDDVFSDRTISAGARLGFHAPYLAVPGGIYNEVIVQKAYNEALISIAELSLIMNKIGLSTQLLSKMLRMGPNDFYFIDTVRKAAVENIEIIDYRQPPTPGKAAFINACDNMFNGLTYERWEGAFSLSDYTPVSTKQINLKNSTAHEIGLYPPEASLACRLIFDQESKRWKVEFRQDETVNSSFFFELHNFYPGSAHLAEIAIGTLAVAATLPASSSRSFNIVENYALEGTDLKQLKQIPPVKCEQACQNDNICKGYAYDKWNKWCFLKSELRLLTLNPKYLSGVPEWQSRPATSASAKIMEPYRGKDFPYAGSTSRASNAKDCEQRCYASSSCVAFSFSKTARACRLMDVVGEYFSDTQHDSGIKRQGD